MQGKGLLSVIMMVAVGTVSMSTTSVARYNTDLVGTDVTMEELALIMAAATEQELTANMGL